MSRPRAIATTLAFAVLSVSTAVSAQETVRVSMPITVSFNVIDVGVATGGSPSSTSMTFSDAVLTSGHALRISVQANGDLTPPSGPSIPASKVSWTTSNVSNGVAINGTLSATAYNQVFQGNVGATAGGCDIAWTLAAPGTPLRASTHQVTLRWKIESVVP